MKKLIALAVLTVGFLVYMLGLTQAEQGVFGRTGANGYTEGRRWVRVEVTGGGNNNGTATIDGADLTYLYGRYIQKVITIPDTGATVPSAYTGTMVDEYGQSLTITTRSTTAIEQIDVPATNQQNWPVIGEITITLTGLGNGKKVSFLVVVH